jgi:hypothetical protein
MELERDNLEARLRQAEISSINIQAEAVKSSPTLFDRLVDAMDSRKVLCIHHVDCSGFRSKLLRAGLSEDEFNLLFEERGLDGRQSGLNHDLKARFEELRLCPLRLYEASPRSSSVSPSPNLISAGSSGDVVKKFLSFIE